MTIALLLLLLLLLLRDRALQLFGYDGLQDGSEVSHNGLVINPEVLICPDGEYVVQVRT
jgi:hypothetical protein